MLRINDEGAPDSDGCRIIELPTGRRNPLPDPERYSRWRDLSAAMEMHTYDEDTSA